MSEYVYTMVGLNKHYGQKHVLKDIYLSFYHGAKIGIVGENGAGKSTLLRIMAGVDKDFQGQAAPAPRAKVRMISQEPQLDPNKSIREHLEDAFADIKRLLDEFNAISDKMGELEGDDMDKALEKMGKLQDKIDAVDGWNLDTKIDMAANALVLPPDDVPVTKLSGGERRRVALCKVLLEQPDLLLLDEPTNHLDAETIDWLEHQLRDYPGNVIISTHDRYFLDNVTKWILELDSGKGIPFEGNYTSWLGQKLEILAKNEKKESARRKALDRELKWIKMSTADRHKQSEARIKEFERLLVEESAAADPDEQAVIQIAPAAPLGDQVIEVKGEKLIDNLSFTVPKGAIVGIIGPNGTGKTTLFKMITGAEKPDSGEITIGKTVKMSHVDQHRDILQGDRTVFDEITEGKSEIVFGKQVIPARSYVGRFNFKGTDQQKLVGNLSGGERNRVHLAKLLKSGGNVLLLDEPTNDLDVGTLRLLEDAIAQFAGCALVISHDRFFLNRICTHILAFEGDAQVSWFVGNYEEYEAKRRKELGDSVVENRRAKYRKLPRQ
jgi:energy-dependent translational throttle protein EttA